MQRKRPLNLFPVLTGLSLALCLSQPAPLFAAEAVPATRLTAACPKIEVNPAPAASDDKKKKGPQLEEKTIKVYQKARKAVEEEDYAAARELLVPAVESARKPADKGLLSSLLGYTYAQQDDYENAALATRAAIDSKGLQDAELAGAWQNLAAYYTHLEKHEHTLEAIDSYLQSGQPVRPELLVVKASTLNKLERQADAVCPLYSAILASTEPKPDWLKMLMQLHYNNDDLDGAAAVQQAIIAREPNDGTHVVQLANIYLRASKNAEGFALLSDAWNKGLLKKDKDIRNLATMYWNNAEYEKTADILRQGIELGILPNTDQIWKNIAQAWKQIGNTDKAIHAYGEAAKTAATGEMALLQGELLSELKRWPEAAAAYSQALAKGGLGKHEGHTYLVLGYAQFRNSEFKPALQNLQKAATYPEKKAEAQAVIQQVKANM